MEQVYIDRMSGKNTDSPELKRKMTFVRAGDTVIVESISCFARNTKDLVAQLTSKDVEFVSQKESIDTSMPLESSCTIFSAVAELEREYTLQRQQEGVDIAVYKGRKPIERNNFEAVVLRWQHSEITAAEAMQRLELNPSTSYRKVVKGR